MATSPAARQFVTWAPLAAVLIVLLPGVSAAQDPVKSFDQLDTRLKVGDTVWVTDAQGREVKGKIQSLSADALALTAGDPRTFAARDVSIIRDRQRDSLKNGTLIGLAIGGGLAAVWCTGAAVDDSPSVSAGTECAEGLIAFGGLGTLLGLGLDAAIPGKMRVVYRAPGAPGDARLFVAPVLTPRMKGVAVSFAF